MRSIKLRRSNEEWTRNSGLLMSSGSANFAKCCICQGCSCFWKDRRMTLNGKWSRHGRAWATSNIYMSLPGGYQYSECPKRPFPICDVVLNWCTVASTNCTQRSRPYWAFSMDLRVFTCSTMPGMFTHPHPDRRFSVLERQWRVSVAIEPHREQMKRGSWSCPPRQQ